MRSLRNISLRHKPSENYCWIVLSVVWLCGFVAPLNMAKVTVLSPVLMASFDINEGTMGIIMSLFYVLGLIMAFPAAAIVNKFGVRKIGIISLVFAILGGLLGVVSQETYLFMISRILEGAGMGVMGVVGVVAISPWFAPSKRGLPLSIWSAWVTVSFIVGLLVFSAVYDAYNSWKLIWLGVLFFDFLVLILFAIFYREPNFVFGENEQKVIVDDVILEQAEAPRVRSVLKLPLVWVLGIMMFAYAAASMAIEGFFTTYVYNNLKTSITIAGIIASSGAILGVIFATISGKVSDKIRSRKKVLVVGWIAGIVYSYFVFMVQDLALFIPIVFLIAIGENATPSMIYASTAEIMSSDKVAGASAMLAFMQNVGMLFGTTFLGNFVTEFGSWSLAAHITAVPLYAIGLVLTIVMWRKLI